MTSTSGWETGTSDLGKDDLLARKTINLENSPENLRTEPTGLPGAMWVSVTPGGDHEWLAGFYFGPEGNGRLLSSSTSPSHLRGTKPEAPAWSTKWIPAGAGLCPQGSPARSVAARRLPRSLEEGGDARHPGPFLSSGEDGIWRKGQCWSCKEGRIVSKSCARFRVTLCQSDIG